MYSQQRANVTSSNRFMANIEAARARSCGRSYSPTAQTVQVAGAGGEMWVACLLAVGEVQQAEGFAEQGGEPLVGHARVAAERHGREAAVSATALHQALGQLPAVHEAIKESLQPVEMGGEWSGAAQAQKAGEGQKRGVRPENLPPHMPTACSRVTLCTFSTTNATTRTCSMSYGRTASCAAVSASALSHSESTQRFSSPGTCRRSRTELSQQRTGWHRVGWSAGQREFGKG